MSRATLTYVFIGLAAAYQLYVTMLVLASASYSGRQKLMQLALVWFIPVVGGLFCHIFLVSDSTTPHKDEAFTRDGGDNPPGIGTGGPHL